MTLVIDHSSPTWDIHLSVEGSATVTLRVPMDITAKKLLQHISEQTGFALPTMRVLCRDVLITAAVGLDDELALEKYSVLEDRVTVVVMGTGIPKATQRLWREVEAGLLNNHTGKRVSKVTYDCGTVVIQWHF